MTREEVKKEILSELGYPVVKVELDDTMWDKIFTHALRWFKAKKGLVKYWVMPIAEGQLCYNYPPNAYEVVEVILPQRSDIASLLSLGFFDLIPVTGIGLGLGSGSQASLQNFTSMYVQLLQQLETRRRVFGAEPDWYTQGGKIFLTTNGASAACYSMAVPAGCCGDTVSGGVGDSVSGVEFGCDVNIGLGMVVGYKSDVIDIPDFRGRDADLIYRYCVALAKQRLARIRGKYKSYPAAGGMVDTDWDTLLEEAKEEFTLLEEEISDSQGAMGFITG